MTTCSVTIFRTTPSVWAVLVFSSGWFCAGETPSPGGQFLFKPWILGVAQQGFLSSVDTWKFFIPGIYRSHSLQREFSFSLSSREMNAEALPASWEMVFLSLPSPTESQLLFHLAPCLCTQINSSDHQAEKTDSILVMVHICHYM